MTTQTAPAFDELSILRDEFTGSLRAAHKAPATIKSYRLAVDQLRDFLVGKQMPTDLGAIRREHVEAFLTDLQERGWKPATRAQRYRSLRVFFGWAVDNDEIKTSPMLRMKPPKVEPPLVPILQEDEIARLLKACEGRDFADRRDMAVIRLFLSTGMRRAEMGALQVSDVDFERHVIVIRSGKGDRPRIVHYGDTTSRALRRYMGERQKHPKASSPALWIGRFGALTDDGIRQIVEKRGEAAGIKGLHPHRFRHDAAHRLMAADVGETNVQILMGWRSPQMLRRYGASAAADRAIEAHRRLAIDDRF